MLYYGFLIIIVLSEIVVEKLYKEVFGIVFFLGIEEYILRNILII